MYFNSHYLVAFYLFIKNNQKNPIYYSRVCPSERFLAPTGPPPLSYQFLHDQISIYSVLFRVRLG